MLLTDPQIKKSWLALVAIARELLCCRAGDRLPTVQEYAERYGCSRGIIQNALKTIQGEAAITLEKRGKIGSFLVAMDPRKLFDLANLQYITGSMPPPLNRYFAALATGVCIAIADCPSTFNFAFMHSSENRAKALRRMVYDFAIVSLHAAKCLTGKYSELEIAVVLPHCLYAPEFVLLSNRPGAVEIDTGATVAVDPNSNDQYQVTMELCREKQVKLLHAPYLKTGVLFSANQADFVVARVSEFGRGKPAQCIPISGVQNRDMSLPAILVNRNSYGLGRILATYLDTQVIADVQQEVLQGRREAEFY